jgi:hypothetical protein
MQKTLLSVMALAFASLVTAATARAQDPAAKPAWVVACAGDMTKHCDAEMKAKGDVRPCLAQHEADLSQECKDVFLRKYKILELCKDDIAKVCGGTTDGKALGKCFNEKQAELSDKCRAALTKGSKEQKKETAAKAEEGGAKAATASAEKPAKGKKKAAKKE